MSLQSDDCASMTSYFYKILNKFIFLTRIRVAFVQVESIMRRLAAGLYMLYLTETLTCPITITFLAL